MSTAWDSNHWPHDYGLMAAYTITFYTLLSMNGQFCRLAKISFVFFKDSFYFEQVPFRLMQTLLSYQRAKNADRQTDSFLALYGRDQKQTYS